MRGRKRTREKWGSGDHSWYSDWSGKLQFVTIGELFYIYSMEL